MSAKQTFTDDLRKVLPYMCVVLVGSMAVLFFVVGLFGEGGLSKTYVIACLILSVGGPLLMTLLTWLFISLMTTRRVSCDLAGCEVATVGRRRVYDSKRFYWSEIIGTRIVTQIHGSGSESWESVHFFVDVKGAEVELLRKQNSTKDFHALIATVNQMTPHLPYVWVGRKEINDRRVLEDSGSYCKVARS